MDDGVRGVGTFSCGKVEWRDVMAQGRYEGAELQAGRLVGMEISRSL